MAPRLPTPTDPDTRRVLDRQVQVLFQVADDVLAGLTLEDCLAKPDPESWTVHRRDGRWFGELPEETADTPVPTLAWTLWHPLWWLAVLLAHTRGDEVPTPESVEWPGPSDSLPRLRTRWATWIDLLDGLSDDDLQSSRLTRFPYTDARPFIHVAGWASMELTKNLSEMCLLHRLATSQSPD
jgi:hypothetical protein